MGDKASRRGAANLGMPLMILAFLAILGFLYWLNVQAREQEAAKQAAIEESRAAAAAEADSGVVRVPAADLQGDLSGFVGTEIRVDTVPVASMLGKEGFWVQLPNKNPFLIAESDSLRASGLSVGAGDIVTVVGTVHTMSDSTLNAWTKSGNIGEGDRLAAEFATHFIEATIVRVRRKAGASAGAPPPRGGDGGGQ